MLLHVKKTVAASTHAVLKGHLMALMLCLLCALHMHAEVIDLKCEGLTAPLGIDTTVPHFSWKHTLTHNGERQTAYEIQVASDSIALVKGRADLWKSGRIKDDNQVMVPYQGAPLAERQLCYWRVRTWDERGHPRLGAGSSALPWASWARCWANLSATSRATPSRQRRCSARTSPYPVPAKTSLWC